MQWEIVIGMETHIQLKTNSKMFSGSATKFGSEPNQEVCAIDLALPGTLPVLNEKAVIYAIRFGLSIQAQISPISIFVRKNYFYPDLPKGYQITQHDLPIIQNGALKLTNGKCVHITRAHLEEDAGKSIHHHIFKNKEKLSAIDFNRAGIPLLEVVSAPDMKTIEEAVLYAKTLHQLVMWLEICDGNMQNGSFRFDANISIKRPEEKVLGTRCEIKNLNSFKFLQQALQHEAERQISLLAHGKAVLSETRLYDPDLLETRTMRYKEEAHDYRYFPDPDLLPLVISSSLIEAEKKNIGDLPSDLIMLWKEKYSITENDAQILIQEKSLVIFYKELISYLNSNQIKIATNFIVGEFLTYLKRDKLLASNSPVSPKQLSILIKRISDETISHKIAKDIFSLIWDKSSVDNQIVDKIIKEKGLRQITDITVLKEIIEKVLSENKKYVSEIQNGKKKAINTLIGKIMHSTHGKANPEKIYQILTEKIKSN